MGNFGVYVATYKTLLHSIDIRVFAFEEIFEFQ